MYCSQCGQQISERHKYCPYCGAPTGAPRPDAAPPGDISGAAPSGEAADAVTSDGARETIPFGEASKTTPSGALSRRPGRWLILAICGVAAGGVIIAAAASQAFVRGSAEDASAAASTEMVAASNGEAATDDVAEERAETIDVDETAETDGAGAAVETSGTFDPFDGAQMQFSGMEPDGTAMLYSIGSDAACKGLTYTLDVRSGLCNGDTVTVTVGDPEDSAWLDAFSKEYGKVPSQFSKEYTVTGVTLYATELADIADDDMARFQDEAMAEFYHRVDADWTEGTREVLRLEYLGVYFLAPAPDVDPHDIFLNYKNRLYLVYKVRTRNVYSEDGESYDGILDYYWYYEFNDIYIDADGAVENYETHETTGPQFELDSGIALFRWQHYTWTYRGYQTMEEMYQSLVNSELQRYTVESTVQDVSLDE